MAGEADQGKRKPGWPKAGPGRPSLKTPELCAEICARLSAGETLTSICSDEHMPARQKVHEWRVADPEFSGLYAQAEKESAESLYDSMSDIERNVLDGKLDQAAARTVLWSRQWRASKRDPDRFGDRKIHQGDKNSPIQHSHKLDFSSLDENQVALIKQLIGPGGESA